MLDKLENLPAGVVGVKARGVVTRDDYRRVLEPILDHARSEGGHVRFLYQFGPEFERFSGSGAWEDARVGLGSLRLFTACAVVTDVSWIGQSVRFARVLMPCPVRVFANEALAEAAAWLESQPSGSHLSHRMLADVGVMVVEPKGPLQAADFDALALVVDPWIAAHGQLNGLVIHATTFPGWENLGGLIRHLKFVKGHHRKLGRVAFAADSALAEFVPHITEHFVEAEVRHFGYDDLDAAIAWAGPH